MTTYYEKGVTPAPNTLASQGPYVTSQGMSAGDFQGKTFDVIPQQPSQQVYAAPHMSGSGICALQQYDHVIVKQQIETLEAFTGFETSNKECGEKSSVVTRVFLGANRPMSIDILDTNQQPVMRINRPFKLWKKNIDVQDGQGGTLGVIRKKFSVVSKKFHVENAAGQLLYTIEGGPIFARKFKIVNLSGLEVGQILKRWGGIAKELFTDADTFTCFFPPDADAVTRALLVATTLFIDLTHFEGKKSR